MFLWINDCIQILNKAHTFTANDRLIGANGSPYTGTLFRQISPILSFLYDNVDSSGNTIRQNSYFSVPIWAEEEDYKDLTSASFIQWKKDQPEYVNVQSSSTPWVDGAEVPADMENSCVVTNGNRTKVRYGAEIFGLCLLKITILGFRYRSRQRF